MLVANILGLGLGPVLTGAVSDMFAPGLGDRSLNLAVGFIALFLVVSAGFHWLAAKALRASSQASS